MTHFRLGTTPPQEWDGELAEEETTRTGERSRWVEFRVYDLDNGDWLAHRAGMSLVYHRPNTTCRTATGRKPGVLMLAGTLPGDAEPCDTCRPPYPDQLGDGSQVRFEVPRHTVNRAATAAELVDILTTARNRITGMTTVKISDPVASLLARLAENYDEFANVMLPEQSTIPVFSSDDDDRELL
jgi:hypothetical protein